ncbi:RHS repeat-associated core domain-containing protein, partial [Thauera sinica]
STAANEDPAGTGTSTTVNLRFPGQYFDRESGLFYNWNRYYDPTIGRYISPDPIGLAGGLNLFGYANQSPLRFTDPKGLVAGVDDAMLLGGILIVGAAMSTPQGQAAVQQIGNAIKEMCKPSEEFCRKRKNYCITFCQYELDMPGRTDNVGPYRACIRRCMNAVGCDY